MFYFSIKTTVIDMVLLYSKIDLLGEICLLLSIISFLDRMTKLYSGLFYSIVYLEAICWISTFHMVCFGVKFTSLFCVFLREGIQTEVENLLNSRNMSYKLNRNGWNWSLNHWGIICWQQHLESKCSKS